MRFCFIILRLLGKYRWQSFSRVIHSERIFSFHCGTFPLYFKVNALQMSLNLNAALSSFIAASLRIIHHSKTTALKKNNNNKKKLPLTCLATQNTICVWTHILIVVVVARAGLFRVRQYVNGPHMFYIYLFIFTLRYIIAPFVTSAAPHQCCAGAALIWPRGW